MRCGGRLAAVAARLAAHVGHEQAGPLILVMVQAGVFGQARDRPAPSTAGCPSRRPAWWPASWRRSDRLSAAAGPLAICSTYSCVAESLSSTRSRCGPRPRRFAAERLTGSQPPHSLAGRFRRARRNRSGRRQPTQCCRGCSAARNSARIVSTGRSPTRVGGAQHAVAQRMAGRNGRPGICRRRRTAAGPRTS